MSNNQLKTTLFLLIILGIAACKTEEKPTESAPVFTIVPPIPALDPKYQTFEVEASKGGVFSLKSGTSITVPPDAFVDGEGAPIAGKLSLKYREFHDASSIYLSGIPMEIKVGEEREHLKTAGMFDLQAEQEGKALALADGKAATVRMASWEAGKDYNYYQLSMDDGNWEDLGQKDPEVNSKRVKLKKEINKMKPGQKFPLGKAYFTFTFDAFLDVFYNDKIKNADKELVKDKMVGYGVNYCNLQTREVIVFEGKKLPAAFFVWKNLSKKALPPLGKRSDTKLTPLGGNRYQLEVLDANKVVTWAGEVEIFMSIKSLLAFPPEYWRSNYQTAMTAIRKKREVYKTMASVFREQEVRELGIYNWDKIWKEESVELFAQFDLGERAGNLLEKEVVFISGDNKTVVRFTEKDWPKLRLIQDKGARIFTLLMDQKVLLYSAKKYNKIDFKELKAMEEPSFVFDMKGEEHAIASEGDLRKLLGI